jgi:hypothetical protein
MRVHTSKKPNSSSKCALWIGALAAAAAIALAPISGRGLMQNTYPHIPPELNRIPDNNQANDINAPQTEKRSFEAANAERKKQIAADSAKLLKLTTALKAEMDKATTDTPSLNLIRKLDEIEKLAHDVKEKMKLTVGSSQIRGSEASRSMS